MIMSETEENDWCAFCLTATDNNRKKIGMAKMFLFFFANKAYKKHQCHSKVSYMCEKKDMECCAMQCTRKRTK